MSPSRRRLEDDLDALGRALGPDKGLSAGIMARVETLAGRSVPVKQGYFTRKWIMRYVTGVAAVLVVAAGLSLILLRPRPAYAQVLEKLEQTRTMSCDLEIGPDEKMHLTVKGEMMRADLPDGTISIGNRVTGKWMAIDPKEHAAMKITMARQPFDLYAWFKDFRDGKEERLGEKVFNGKKATGFHVTLPEPGASKNARMPLTLWVDAATNLPVEAEGNEGGQVFHATNFKWDETLDEKLFSMDIPAGYKVQDMGGVSVDDLKAPPGGAEATKLALKRGVGIGELKFGDDAARVTAILGKPESVTQDISWGYPSKGLWVTVSPKQGVITIMVASKKAFPVFNVNDFPGKLENGLGIGSTREEVEKAYGRAERTESTGKDTVTLYYDKAYVWFMIQSGNVIEINLNPSLEARALMRARAAQTTPAIK